LLFGNVLLIYSIGCHTFGSESEAKSINPLDGYF
jgi:hypothetical protein